MNKLNPYFIGNDLLNVEGRTIKHIGLIKYFNNISTGKISKTKMKFLSMDLETNHLTGELKLIGIYNGEKYTYFYNEDFLKILFRIIKYCDFQKRNLIYWSNLDPSILYKLLLLSYKNKKEQLESIDRYLQINGKWNHKTKEWNENNPPLVKCIIDNYEFGIVTAIRRSYQFYYFNLDERKIHTVWSYDISSFYADSLENIGKKFFSYYTKIDEESHKIDWIKFNNNENYKSKVLLSNEFDCKICYDSADMLQKDFKDTYGYYPKTLISVGSLTRCAYECVITDMFKNIEDDKTRKFKILEELKSIPIVNNFESWNHQLGEEKFKDFLCMISEVYSGAKIDCYGFGYTETAFTSDISGAYNYEIGKLPDLRNSKIKKGIGEPKQTNENEIVIIRGVVKIDKKNELCQYHTMLTKHPINKELNICSLGEFKTSYFIEERNELLKHGAIFENEEWYIIKTEGKRSVLSYITEQSNNLRFKYLSENNPKEWLPKTIINCEYGTCYEATASYELKNNEIINVGYRAGQCFNNLFSAKITANTRLKIFKACVSIVKNGGKPIFNLTDCVTWEGKITDLNPEFWKEKKTIGYFEKPEEIKNLVSLGSGRYEYYKLNKETNIYDKYVYRRRGLHIKELDKTEIKDKEGVNLNEFNWYDTLKKVGNNSFINVKVSILITAGVVRHSKKWSIKDLGLIADNIERKIDLIIGKQKRYITIKNYNDLQYKMFYSKPLYLTTGFNGEGDYPDYTLRILRNELQKLKILDPKIQKKELNKMYCKTYYNKIKLTINDKYIRALKYGFTKEEALKISKINNKEFRNLIKNKIYGRIEKENE